MKLLKFTKENKEDLYKIGIYKIFFLNDLKNRCYVGSALIHNKRKNQRGFYHRWTRHLSDLEQNKHSNKKLQNVFNKYGVDNLRFEIIVILEKNLDKKVYEQIETNYIEKLNSVDNGFNILKLAYTSLGIKRSEESKLKNSLAKSTSLIYQYDINGRFLRSFRSLKEVGMTYKDINVKSLLSVFRRKNSKFKDYYWFRVFKGEKCEIPKIKEKEGKVIYQYDLKGNFIKKWLNFIQIKKELKIEISNIHAVLRGERNIAFGYYWNYDFKNKKDIVKDRHLYFTNRPFKECKKRQKQVDCFDLNEVFIKTYNSITKAKEETGAKNILAVLRGKRKSSGNFKWKLTEKEIK